jgi:hypothetical protein
MALRLASLLLVFLVSLEAARPWRYDLPQERKNYDTQWVYRPYQERIDKYYQNPNVSLNFVLQY